MTLPIATLTAFGRQCAPLKLSHIASRWYIGRSTPPCSRHFGGHAVGVVGDAPHGEEAERRRQRVVAAVVRDAQGALEADGEVAADLNAIGMDGDVKHGGAPFSLA